MEKLTVFWNQPAGPIKPMHAVNNGPVNRRLSNMDAFREAGIPYVRNHDAAHYSGYGGEHTVDVHAIFPDFAADPYDPASYDFACTDAYLADIDAVGAKTFYRLGSKIEHGVKKYGTLPPPDFRKWAVICEHIIRHYNEGWANGFHYGIEYWEIWNEPVLGTPENRPTWGGTEEEFFELFRIALTHLKEKFPQFKIGGPAVAWPDRDYLALLLKDLPILPDFYSWHGYRPDPERILELVHEVRAYMDELGLEKAESIYNEWNYVKAWSGEGYLESFKTVKGLKGSAFTAAVICGCQNAPLDLLMYYDARPCAFNGMFCTDWVCEKLKGYYPFKMFNRLYQMGQALTVSRETGCGIYLAAAKDEDGKRAVMLTHFFDEDNAPAKEITLALPGLDGEKTANIYTLDETHDMELTETRKVNGDMTLTLPLFTTLLIEFE